MIKTKRNWNKKNYRKITDLWHFLSTNSRTYGFEKKTTKYFVNLDKKENEYKENKSKMLLKSFKRNESIYQNLYKKSKNNTEIMSPFGLTR